MNTQKKATIKKSQNHVNSPKLFFQWFINFYISKSENTIKKKKKYIIIIIIIKTKTKIKINYHKIKSYKVFEMNVFKVIII